MSRALNAPATVHLARCGEASWLKVSLEDEAPNPYGVGATVRVVADGTKRRRGRRIWCRICRCGLPLILFGPGL